MAFLGALLTAIPGVLTSVMAYLKTRADADVAKYTTGVQADTQVILAQVQADLETRKLVALQRAADRGSLWTAWMLPTAFGLCMFHFGATVFDSMPLFGHEVGSWGIAALPGWMAEAQRLIIISAAGVVSIQHASGVARRIFTNAR